MPKYDTIPLALQPQQRATGTTDERAINVLYEPAQNAITRDLAFQATKRFGLANSTQPPGGAAAGRGVYGWGATSKIYSVFANKIYSATSDLGVTLAASSGRCWFAETPATASSQLLIISDGTDNYNITTSDVITKIDENDDAQYPSTNLGPVLYVEGYLVQATTSYLVNTPLNSFTSWLAADVKPLDAHGDALECIHRQKDQVMAMGKNSIEMFFNAGAPTGSPFQRIDQNQLSIGIATRNSLAVCGELAFFISEAPARGDGQRSVYMIQGTAQMQDISTVAVRKLLTAEGSSISSCTAWAAGVNGHIIYCINLSSADRSLVYSVTSGLWTEAEAAAGSAKFNVVSATALNGVTYLQDAANGRIYTASSTTYQDSGTTFTVTLQTGGRDQGTSNIKVIPWVELVGDIQASGTATLEASDDDFTTWKTIGTFDLTQERKCIYRCGSYRGKRAWRVTHAANTAYRSQALRIAYEIGSN